MKKLLTILLLFSSGLLYGQMGDYFFTKGVFLQLDSATFAVTERLKMDSVLEANIILRDNVLIVKYYEFETLIFSGGFQVNLSGVWTADFSGEEFVCYSQTVSNILICFWYCPTHKNIAKFMLANDLNKQCLIFSE